MIEFIPPKNNCGNNLFAGKNHYKYNEISPESILHDRETKGQKR